MEFYKIWQTRSGLFGVNKLTLGDLVGIQFLLVLLLMIIVAVLIAFFPVIFFTIYVLLMVGLDSDEVGSTTRLGVNIITIITTIYFLLDFHFGWYSHEILATSMYAETYDAIAVINLSVALMSIPLFFVGHEIYRVGQSRLIRVVIFLAFIFFGFKFTNGISKAIITNTIEQYNDAELTNDREELKVWDKQNYGSDEQRLQDQIDALEKEKVLNQKMKDFDDNFANEYY